MLEASLARANAALAAHDLLIEPLRGQIARLRRMQFGASSEKLTTRGGRAAMLAPPLRTYAFSRSSRRRLKRTCAMNRKSVANLDLVRAGILMPK